MAASLASQTQTPDLSSSGAQPTLAPKDTSAADTNMRVKQFEADSQKLIDEQRRVGEDTRRRNAALEGQIALQKPPEFKPQQYVAPESTSLQSQWGSLAMAAAMLGSAFTRTHLTTALNAGAAVMQSYQQKDQAAAAHAYKVWDTSMHNYAEAVRYQQAAYREAVASITRREQINTQAGGVEERAAQARLTALAHAFQDENMLKLGMDRGMQAQLNELDRRAKEHDQLKLHTADLQREKAAMDEVARLKAEWAAHPEKAPSPPEQFSQTMAALERGGSHAKAQVAKIDDQIFQQWQALPENQNATPEQEAAFRQSTRSARSGLVMYMMQFRVEHPNANAEELKRVAQKYTTETTAQNRFLSGAQGNTIRSLNVVVSHLQTMQELGTALKNGDMVAFNHLAQIYAEQTGSPVPTNFDTAKQIVGAEVIKAIGVAGAGTQSERQEASNAFTNARSPEQLNQAINVARRLLVGQLNGLRQQFVTSTGLPVSTFDGMLDPKTRDFFGDNKTSSANTAGAAPHEASTAAPVHVSTPEEAAKLAPGTPYVTPDGEHYVR